VNCFSREKRLNVYHFALDKHSMFCDNHSMLRAVQTDKERLTMTREAQKTQDKNRKAERESKHSFQTYQLETLRDILWRATYATPKAGRP